MARGGTGAELLASRLGILGTGPDSGTGYGIPMHVYSVQIGSAETLDLGSRTVETGINKLPVDEIVLRPAGVEGDAVMNVNHHGGPDQAVYVYSAEDYEWWAQQLDRPLTPGMLGENLTISSAPSIIRVGDRIRGDAVTLEVTSPRIPCATFAARMSEPDWIRRFRDAHRPGFYCRVLEPGRLRSGDPLRWIAAPESNISIRTMVDHIYAAHLPPEQIRQALASPIARRARVGYEARLERGTS